MDKPVYGSYKEDGSNVFAQLHVTFFIFKFASEFESFYVQWLYEFDYMDLSHFMYSGLLIRDDKVLVCYIFMLKNNVKREKRKMMAKQEGNL